MHRVAEDEAGVSIFPPACELFNAFRETPLERVKVVIIGQDPYPHKRACPRPCLLCKEGVKPPKSLINIFKELYSDILLDSTAPHPNIRKAATMGKRGRAAFKYASHRKRGEPPSHAGYGWDIFTQRAIEAAAKKEPKRLYTLGQAGSKARGASLKIRLT